jgi:two-component system, OmpR family, phosphate regulon sensor histidine kinase PhoR
MVGCSVIIAFIIVTQLYWLRHIYNLEQHQFKRNVLKSLQAMLRETGGAANPKEPLKDIVDRMDENTFLVELGSVPPRDSIKYHLSSEFEYFGVWAYCKVFVYGKEKNDTLYSFNLDAATTGQPDPSAIPMAFPLNHANNYMMLYFPHRSKYIIQEMSFWIATAILLTILLVGLSFALLYLYRQKFLNELQKDFVNNFTHEFKTPLAVMKIAADVMVQPGIEKKPERLSKYGHVIKEQTEHLQGQVERLLKTATVENSKLPVKKEPCQLNGLVQSALAQIEPFVISRNAKIDFLPDENEPVINADRSQLQLVIVNLVENAVKYCVKPPHIIIELKNGDNEFYSIMVKDNGVGIEEKNLKFLFKKFYRVPTGNVHNVAGFGLGLNFVKKVVDAHEGRIQIQSVVGIGSEFKLLLPKK